MRLGLKSSADPNQVESRLKHQPSVFEFYTSEENFTKEGLSGLEQGIRRVKDAGIRDIILHHPVFYRGEMLELVAKADCHPQLVDFIDYSTRTLLDLAAKYDIQVLVHGSYEKQTHAFIADYRSLAEATEVLWQRLDTYQDLGKDRIMFENSISPLFCFGDRELEREIFKRGYRLAYDVSHAFIALKGNQEALEESLAYLKDHIVHYHLVDSKGQEHDSLPLGQGSIDWKRVIPLLNPKATGIYEIDLADMLDPKEQLASHAYLQQLFL